MAEIGELKRAKDLGYTGRAKYIWFPCPSCKVPRFTILASKEVLCKPCAAQKRARERTPLTYSGEGRPEIGDTTLAKSLGYAGRGIYFFDACSKCGRTRWVRRQGRGSLCVHCTPKPTGQSHHRWANGYKTKRGYVYVRIDKDDPMFSMSRQGWILEHRLVVAHRVGRPLLTSEVVHHINGNKSENRSNNLLLLKERDHNSHSTLSEIRDSVPDEYLNLRHYNTPSDHPDGIVEGIVQSFGNEGRRDSESV